MNRKMMVMNKDGSMINATEYLKMIGEIKQ